LSQGVKALAEGGPQAKIQKRLRNDSESVDVVNVHTG